MDHNYSSTGINLWSQLGRVIAENFFLRKWSKEQMQSVISFSFGCVLIILADEIEGGQRQKQSSQGEGRQADTVQLRSLYIVSTHIRVTCQ
jgi:hypothetical protein